MAPLPSLEVSDDGTGHRFHQFYWKVYEATGPHLASRTTENLSSKFWHPWVSQHVTSRFTGVQLLPAISAQLPCQKTRQTSRPKDSHLWLHLWLAHNAHSWRSSESRSVTRSSMPWRPPGRLFVWSTTWDRAVYPVYPNSQLMFIFLYTRDTGHMYICIYIYIYIIYVYIERESMISYVICIYNQHWPTMWYLDLSKKWGMMAYLGGPGYLIFRQSHSFPSYCISPCCTLSTIFLLCRMMDARVLIHAKCKS